MIHWCGCETIRDKEGVIVFKNMCKRHIDNRKYVWIVVQHEDERK